MNYIKDIPGNFWRLYSYLSSRYSEVNGFDFYRFIFPDCEYPGELNYDFSKPNAIYLYKDERDEGEKRRLRRRIMLKDSWEQDYMDFVECNPLAFCSGLSFRGRANRLEHAHRINAMIFDLDAVGEDELLNLFSRIGKDPGGIRTLPMPTFIVMSGTGLHLYYVFDEPIDLFPNIKLQMKQLKHDLTTRIWDYGGTTKLEKIQYQSINQGFRMPGSLNSKYNLPVTAFRVGDKVTLDYLNSYTLDLNNKVDVTKPFRPSKYTLDEAKEKFPEWYQRVIIDGEKNSAKWHIKPDLYYWWLRQRDKISGGHRYFYLMCMCIYAVKCDIPKKQVKKDMEEIFDYLSDIQHTNELTEDDLNSALEAYDRGYYNFTRDDISKLTAITIEKNKRNYRTQRDHIKIMNFVRDNISYPDGGWRNKDGRPSKEELVKEYVKLNPDESVTEIARALKISRTTVYKYFK